MALAAETILLGGRYRLVGSPIATAGDTELWAGVDEEEWAKPYLVKAWPFPDAKPDDVQRALWDAELRTLYRIRSTPESEHSLLQLHNVGIDHDQRCFVMIFETPGLASLTSVLTGDRGNHAWLSGRVDARRELWLMLARIANGLALLHEQQVVHRCVSPDSIFLDPKEGPESAMLGGFEWSVRLGRPSAVPAAQIGWETAPEMLDGNAAFGPHQDWFGFGMLAARCMLSIEHLNTNNPDPRKRYQLVLDHLARARKKLTPIEHELLARLIAEEPATRPRHHSEIKLMLQEVIRQLREPMMHGADSARHVVVFDPRSRSLVDVCLERGLRETLKLNPGETFDPQRPEHLAALQSFLYADFSGGATITPIPARSSYTLTGKSMHLEITRATDPDGRDAGWTYAFCRKAREYMSTAPNNQTAVAPGRIEFLSTKDKRNFGNQVLGAPSWDLLLPQVDTARARRREQERLLEFLRITNQIDVLIRDAELFRCEIIAVTEADGVVTEIQVREVARKHSPLRMFQREGGMAAFLFRERSSGQPGSNRIQLCDPDNESIDTRPAEPEWEVADADVQSHTVTLRPVGAHPRFPSEGDVQVLRTTGLGGQVLLIRRRKEAIEKLAKHTYLLESLSSPGRVLMDSGSAPLPVPLTPDTVDSSKLTQIEKILAVRPIYTLQGPPGTGKTHLVTWLLREILEEDPVAQILITAQGHAAVDVLRAKVEEEAFKDVPADRKPLAIRLRRTVTTNGAQESGHGSEREVAKKILHQAIARLEATPPGPLSAIQADWLTACKEMLTDLMTEDGSVARQFRELVKRSANITYSTTGDGDLAALAGEVSYDWSIVEEAGKAHGFELALPLFLGHQWLLIGDPKQLSPYRIEDYEKALSDLDATVAAFEALDRPGRLLDRELLQLWRERTPEQRSDFGEYCRVWVRVFEHFHKLCAYHEPENGLLTGQHRMHPVIGDLVSDVYYDGRLEHYTRDASTGKPVEGIKHRLSGPDGLGAHAVLWLDIPAAAADTRSAEHTAPKYRNFAEACVIGNFLQSLKGNVDAPQSVAVLSPYAQQVGYLKEKLDTDVLRQALSESGLRFAKDPRGGPRTGRDGFFTVDSFQGNQAEIIVVSLVRNNAKPSGSGLGFLDEARRLNVLFSRAERLLVLAGSWDFFRFQVEHVSRNPEQPSRTQHLAFALDRLQTWFADGTALRITADPVLLDPLGRPGTGEETR
ncbi:AAA domain-containing protein [Amycolatopsis sp. NPDC003676]